MKSPNIKYLPRLGTTKLLKLTASVPEPDRDELMQYIGHLEQREADLVDQINNLIRSVDIPNGDNFPFESAGKR